MSTQQTYFHIFNSPEEMFMKAKSVTLESLKGFCNASNIFEECESNDSFCGDWARTCRKFENSEFDDEAALTDEIIDDINTIDFNEIKWKFMQRLCEGDAVDVERFLADNERCWNGCRRIPKLRRSIRIYVNFGGNCFRTQQELAVAGAVGVTFSEIMESMGIAAEIWAVAQSIGMDANGNDYIDMIKVKAQNEYADMGLINFILGDDGVFRNAMFRIDCIHAVENGFDTSFGLGRSEAASLDDLGLTDEEKESAIIVPQIFDRESAKEWLKEVLKDQEKLHNLTKAKDVNPLMSGFDVA